MVVIHEAIRGFLSPRHAEYPRVADGWSVPPNMETSCEYIDQTVVAADHEWSSGSGVGREANNLTLYKYICSRISHSA